MFETDVEETGDSQALQPFLQKCFDHRSSGFQKIWKMKLAKVLKREEFWYIDYVSRYHCRHGELYDSSKLKKVDWSRKVFAFSWSIYEDMISSACRWYAIVLGLSYIAASKVARSSISDSNVPYIRFRFKKGVRHSENISVHCMDRFSQEDFKLFSVESNASVFNCSAQCFFGFSMNSSRGQTSVDR